MARALPVAAPARAVGESFRDAASRTGPAPDFLDWACRMDLTSYLPDDLMVKADRASMAVGLELREPLLDHPFTAAGLSLPSSLRYDRATQTGKLFARSWLAKFLPAALIDRPKRGFTPPLDIWLLLGPLHAVRELRHRRSGIWRALSAATAGGHHKLARMCRRAGRCATAISLACDLLLGLEPPSPASRTGHTMLVIISTHPIQYQTPIWRALAETAIPFQVWYLTDFGIEASHDKEFGEKFRWDIDTISGYPHRILKSSAGATPGNFWACRTSEDLAAALRTAGARAVWIQGWQVAGYWQAAFAASGTTGAQLWLRGESNDLAPAAWWKRGLKKQVLGRLFDLVDRFFYIGAASRRFYRSFGVPERKLVAAPYAVDNARFEAQARALRPQRAALRDVWGIAPDAFCILFCGKFIAKKHPLDIVKAVALLQRSGRLANAHILFAGAGELANDLRRACDVVFDASQSASAPASPGRPKASFAGFLNQTEVSRAYVAADCLVLPSDFGETWGLVVNEAMASGLPVIVSDACGCAEDLAGPQGTFPLGDIAALADRLEVLLRQSPSPAAPPSSWTPPSARLKMPGGKTPGDHRPDHHCRRRQYRQRPGNHDAGTGARVARQGPSRRLHHHACGSGKGEFIARLRQEKFEFPFRDLVRNVFQKIGQRKSSHDDGIASGSCLSPGRIFLRLLIFPCGWAFSPSRSSSNHYGGRSISCFIIRHFASGIYRIRRPPSAFKKNPLPSGALRSGNSSAYRKMSGSGSQNPARGDHSHQLASRPVVVAVPGSPARPLLVARNHSRQPPLWHCVSRHCPARPQDGVRLACRCENVALSRD